MWDTWGTRVIACSTLGNNRAVCFEMNKLFIYLPSVAQHGRVNQRNCPFVLFLFLFNKKFCSWKDKTKHPSTIQKSNTSGIRNIFKQHLSRRMKHSQLLLLRPQRWVFPAVGFSSGEFFQLRSRRAVQGAEPPREGAGAPPSARRGRGPREGRWVLGIYIVQGKGRANSPYLPLRTAWACLGLRRKQPRAASEPSPGGRGSMRMISTQFCIKFKPCEQWQQIERDDASQKFGSLEGRRYWRTSMSMSTLYCWIL